MDVLPVEYWPLASVVYGSMGRLEGSLRWRTPVLGPRPGLCVTDHCARSRLLAEGFL